MARINKAQKAGLDFLDQIFFNELVVHQGMNAEEQQQLATIVTRVTQMVERKYSGREAEIVKHLVYYLLEVSLANTLDEWKQAVPVVVPATDLSKDTIEAVGNFMNDFQMAFMLALTEKSTGLEVNDALEIFEVIKDEFVGYSALVRRDLVRRCFSWEFRDASLGTYCWLTVAGVLPVTKNGTDRINSEFNSSFIERLALVADYEMITHGLNMMTSKDNSVAVFLGHPKFELKEATIDRLLDIQKVFNESSLKSSLRGIPLINMRDLTSASKIEDFFEQWGSRKVRLRTHTGTLASWLGTLGAGMVEMKRSQEYYYAAQEKFKSGAESLEVSDLKIAAIFNACDNKNTITEFVKGKLLECGLQINADTLYRNHSIIGKTTLRLVNMYCKVTRDAGVVMSGIHDDTFYSSVFIHAEKLNR
jgi:hypothetical protein